MTESRFKDEFSRMRRRQAFMHRIVNGGILAFVLSLAIALLLLVVWTASQIHPESILLQIWDGLLFIVRELGKAWRGQ